MLPVIDLQNSYAVENISGNIKSLLQPPRTRTELRNNWIKLPRVSYKSAQQ